MARGLDHMAHAVRNLDAAAALYRGLGFTVGSRNRHPWGTHNYIVQLPGFFIELLTLAEPDKLGDDGFSKLFGLYTATSSSAERGCRVAHSGIDALQSRRSRFPRRRIAASEVMRFEREGRRPDGSAVKVGFSLAFAEDKRRPTSTSRLAGSTIRRISGTRPFRNMPTASPALPASSPLPMIPSGIAASCRHSPVRKATRGKDGFTIATPRGAIEVTTPAAFLHRYGVSAPDVSRGARLAALRFATKDASLLQGAPEFAGLAGLYAGNAAVIGPQDAMGAVLVFESA